MNLKSAWSRRSFLSTLAAISSSLFAPAELRAKPKKPKRSSADGNPIVPITSGLGSTGDICAELGVTPLININGTLTVIGGSVMAPEVMELMRMGNEHFVLIDELEVAAGKFIAKLCKSPAGYTGLVTEGAAAALMVGYAGMMTEDLEPRIRACPDVTGFPKTEVIIQKSHRYPFDHQIRQTGATLVEVETKEEMINAINPRTLAIHFTNILSDKGQVSGPETIEIAKAHGLYTFNDAAAIGIGSMGAGASGMRGRDPKAPADDHRAEDRRARNGRGPNTFGFAVWQLKDGEDEMIADRLVEIFSAALQAQ